MDIKLVGIVGLGLIGGSIAKALKEKLNIDVIGIDNDSAQLEQALSSHTIIKGSNDLNELKNCNIIFLCLPILESIKILKDVSYIAKEGCIITDVGSTKEEIINTANKIIPKCKAFIGGHPIAGSEKRGFYESKSHMFENAYYILTPSKTSNNEQLSVLIRLIKGIGALPIIMNSVEHDFVTAAISHTPHVIASALVNTVHNLNDDMLIRTLAAGGFKDITRIASSDPIMWQSICFSNSKNISNVIDKFIEGLKTFKFDLENQNYNEIYKHFDNAKTYRDSFSTINRGDVEPLFNLFVDVKDQPGIIGKIATLLGNNNINIKNIEILNSREHQFGCLAISFEDKNELENALTILKETGYKVEV